jgi:hypothetical protein
MAHSEQGASPEPLSQPELGRLAYNQINEIVAGLRGLPEFQTEKMAVFFDRTSFYNYHDKAARITVNNARYGVTYIAGPEKALPGAVYPADTAYMGLIVNKYGNVAELMLRTQFSEDEDQNPIEFQEGYIYVADETGHKTNTPDAILQIPHAFGDLLPKPEQ